MYQGDEQVYGDDVTTYIRSGAYLSGPGLVEDWGCGWGMASRFIGAPYRGIDGADRGGRIVQADLRTYRSDVPKALMRHVLEHNWEWRDILDNFLSSFTDRAVLVLFVPPGKGDVDIPGVAWKNVPAHGDEPPGLQLDEEDLLHILDRNDLVVTREILTTKARPFSHEEMFFMEKKVVHDVR